jgi:hypothetical protein
VFLNVFVAGVTGEWQNGGIIWEKDPIGLSAWVLMARTRLRSLTRPLKVMPGRDSACIVDNVSDFRGRTWKTE